MEPPFSQKTSKIAQMKADASRAKTSKADIARDLDIARGRKEFFSNRPDVSDDRALRRMTQADELQRFKNLYTKPVQGSSNLLQMTADAPRTLAEEEMRLANLYGPTFAEIGSDIGFGLGSIAKGVGDRIQSGSFGLFGLAKDLFNKFTDNATKAKNALVQGFNNLTDVEQEVIKNPNKYSRMSSHPRVQGIKDIEAFQMSELDKANLIKENMDRVTTVVDQDDSFRRTPATGITTSPTVFDNRFVRMPGSGYQAGAGLPAITTNNIQIKDGKAKPITDEQFIEQQQKANEIFSEPFFNQTSNQMNQPQFEIVTDYVSPEDRMQNLINQNMQNNNTMFNSGVMTPSETEDIFGINLRQ